MGFFITVEGIEGVGKSTCIGYIRDHLQSKHHVICTREPGGTPMAEAIRGLLLTTHEHEPVAAITELLLVFAARAQHVQQVIRPALEQGQVVICDRFADTSCAYQGAGRGMDAALIQALSEATHPGIEPDLTFLLDVPLDKARKRLNEREQLDRIEQEGDDFFLRVRDGYLKLAQRHDRYRVIDASAPIDQVLLQVKQHLEDCLHDR